MMPADTTQHDDLQLLVRALNFAAQKHTRQRRKDAAESPYINHPNSLIDVLANEVGITEIDVLAAAALHDTIEDTETTPEQLRAMFGERITGIVLEVTDDKDLPSHVRKRLQIDHAHKKSREAALVKFADKICNLRDVANSPPAAWTLQRRREYFDWGKAVVDGLPPVNAALRALFDKAYALKP